MRERLYNVTIKEIALTGVENGSEHRTTGRTDLALQISFLNLEGKTINISASGVYFEVVTSDMNSFSPGTIIPIEISAIVKTPGCDERNIKLKGQGLVVRCDVKNTIDCSSRLGVALEFKDRLKVLMN